MIVNCFVCKKEVYRPPASLKINKTTTCSEECRKLLKRSFCTTEKECFFCKKKIRKINSQVKKRNYCSRSCQYKSVSLLMAEKNNTNWKGDGVGYYALHSFIRSRFKKPKVCTRCKKENSLLDLANISQEYKRDIKDWWYLCRKCHMITDGRLNKFRKLRKLALDKIK